MGSFLSAYLPAHIILPFICLAILGSVFRDAPMEHGEIQAQNFAFPTATMHQVLSTLLRIRLQEPTYVSVIVVT